MEGDKVWGKGSMYTQWLVQATKYFWEGTRRSFPTSGFTKDPKTEFTSQGYKTHVYTISTRTFSSISNGSSSNTVSNLT